MARPLRLEHPGALWHVTSRGNARQRIIIDDLDRLRFVETLGRVVEATRWRLHAWVLMTNHYHLMVETPDANLARGMRQLNGIYSQAFNRRHERVGHVFQGRYKGILVEQESHLLELVRYIALNPVRAGMVSSPARHRWGSYAETAGYRLAAGWLEVDWTLAQFGGSPGDAHRRLREFVAAGRGAAYRPWDELRGQMILGSDGFAASIGERVRGKSISPEVPRAQRFPAARPRLVDVEAAARDAFRATPTDLARRLRHPARKAFALLARRVSDARLSEIATPLGLSPRSVSALLSRAQELERRDRVFRTSVEAARERLLRSVET